MGGSRDFDTLAPVGPSSTMIVGRIDARNAKRVDIERASLKPLPARRTTEYEGVPMRVLVATC